MPDGLEVGEPVQDGHVGHAVGARQFPRLLQPAGHTQVAQHSVNPCRARHPATGLGQMSSTQRANSRHVHDGVDRLELAGGRPSAEARVDAVDDNGLGKQAGFSAAAVPA